jgi:hypothetical protein
MRPQITPMVPNEKPQTSPSEHQRNSKHQAPPKTTVAMLDVWQLEFLELGDWNLDV